MAFPITVGWRVIGKASISKAIGSSWSRRQAEKIEKAKPGSSSPTGSRRNGTKLRWVIVAQTEAKLFICKTDLFLT